MGMQCHFSLNDLPAATKVVRSYCPDFDAVSFYIADKFWVSDGDGKNVWFDIGSATDEQMDAIRFLVLSRTCFQCS